MAFSLIKRSFALWWHELILLTFLNVLWLLLQFPIISGPPATAAMYVIARRVLDGELIEPGDVWQALRQMFLPAWKWGAVNLFFFAVLVINFWAYRDVVGQGWAIMRLLWAVSAFGWFTLNLFYWPLWLAQSDRRMVNTLRNCLVLVLKAPGYALTLAIFCALLIAASVLIILPLVITLMAWLALISTLAVEEAIREFTDVDNQSA